MAELLMFIGIMIVLTGLVGLYTYIDYMNTSKRLKRLNKDIARYEKALDDSRKQMQYEIDRLFDEARNLRDDQL